MTYIKSKSFPRTKSISNRGAAILSLVMGLALFLTGLLYLIQTNSAVSQTYKIRQQKKHLEELQKENSSLAIEAARLQSPVNLEEIAKNLGMVEAEKVVYLEKKGVVAVKQ